ncbi:MAG: glycoside hydrolase domain-containing protein [Chitinophagaceae bacterium]
MNRLLTLLPFLFLASLALGQEIKYSASNNDWNPDSLGNQRAVLHVSGNSKLAHAIIPWRRHDTDPQNKRLILQDAKTGSLITQVKTGNLTQESGEIWFEPVSGPGDYYVYYLPYRNEGRSNYPKGVYLRPVSNAGQEWISPGVAASLAIVTGFQSVNEFNSFYPMEIAATGKELAALEAKNPAAAYLVFPEDRMHPVKMTDAIPQRWILKGIKKSFTDTAAKGEFLAFQFGVYARKDLQNLRVSFSSLKSGSNSIDASYISCINTDGTSYDNKPVKFTVDVLKGKVQSLWCGIDVPLNTMPGTYQGMATISTTGQPVTNIRLSIVVKNKILTDGGISQPEKQTRLKWLNSTMAQENTVIAPYTPLDIIGDTAIAFLGRKIIINTDGFPKQIQTFFTTEMTGYQKTPNNLLYEGIHFHFTRASDAKDIKLQNGPVKYLEKSPGTVRWQCSSLSDSLQMNVNASLEFDGFMTYTVQLIALNDLDFSDITMHIPFRKDKTDYLMGLGEKGEKRPEKINWKWDVATKNQDGAWIGNVNAGLQFSLRDEKYVRPLNTNFYLQKPLVLPASWSNGGKGGIDVAVKGASMLTNNYSGPREMKKGDTLYFNFNLLVTPFHTINTDFQWANRFYHKYNRPDSIKATGATIVNIHHATPINPYINYPFIEYKKMKAYIDDAHSKGLKVKIYNTVRELSNHAYEIFPLRSLGHEIFSTGKGGGFSWLQEHLGNDYIAAWFVPEIKDAAIVNSGMSRWHNYYVEGMNWLTKNVGIDGIYLDDVAFDRVTMKRIKRVLTADGHPGIIDLHSANQFNKSDGFNNSANLYMEHFPYLNRLWFGEYFDYEKNGPDFFLTEVSGIPFGLMGEMLQDGGNAWRGMIYGMTNRMPWSDNADPRPIWKLWDEFGIQGSEMIGYWSDNCPIKTDNSRVLATVYRKGATALVSIASWADADVEVKLQIDWSKLGIDPAKASIRIPEVKNFQKAMEVKVGDALHVPKGKGFLLLIK